MLYAGDEITQALDAEPEGFDAGLAVVLAGEESAELCDQADELANDRHLLRWLLLVEDKGAGPFRFGEEQIGRPLRVDASQADQALTLPGTDPIAAIANRSFAAVILNGRPPFLPRARAEASPATVRSEINSRSNSARAAKIPNTSLPAAVVVSTAAP